MTDRDLDRLLDTLQYEGYLLYPFRPSIKNSRRWNSGALFPRKHAEARGGLSPCLMRMELLLAGPESVEVRAKVRFLRVEARTIGKSPDPDREIRVDAAFPRVPSLEVSGVVHVPWKEGLKREAGLPPQPLSALAKQPVRHAFQCPGDRRRELLRDRTGRILGDVVRDTAPLCGVLELSAHRVGDGVHRLTLNVSNQTRMADYADLAEAELCAFLATHVLLRAEGGAFLSLIDPPSASSDAAKACRNIGNWPILVGAPGCADAVLGSPIILPDYPQSAPESPGDLFDSTEIDEILSLRVQTLTDAEKRALSALDPRGRELLERTESLAQRQRKSLHGAWRSAKEAPGAS